MGFDISSTGNHKTPKGEYFRNNVWWWRPLAQYIIDHTNCVNEDDVELINIASVDTLHKLAIKYSDAVIIGSKTISDDLNKFIIDSDKYVIPYQNDEDYVDAYDALYDELLEEIEVYS